MATFGNLHSVCAGRKGLVGDSESDYRRAEIAFAKLQGYAVYFCYAAKKQFAYAPVFAFIHYKIVFLAGCLPVSAAGAAGDIIMRKEVTLTGQKKFCCKDIFGPENTSVVAYSYFEGDGGRVLKEIARLNYIVHHTGCRINACSVYP